MPSGVYPRPPRKPQRIRNLTAGEHIPEGEPRRYPDQQGYIRLRWRVAVGEMVEVREHRVVDGIVTDAPHRHHLNHVKDDNRPDNLVSVDPITHAHIHTPLSFDVLEAHALYLEGWSTTELGERYGIHASNVWRAFSRRGLSTRPIGADSERGRERRSDGLRRAWASGRIDRTAHGDKSRAWWASLEPDDRAARIAAAINGRKPR